MAKKNCSNCGESKPLSAFPIRRASRDGLSSICKPCAVKKSQAWYAANLERKKAYDADYNKTPRRLEKQAAYRALTRKEASARAKAWYIQNTDRAKAWHRDHFAKFRERHYEKSRAWKANNPEKVNANTAKRRAIQAQAIPPWADLKAIRALYAQAKREGKHVDHIVPLRSKLVCGLHCEANLQLLTPQENFVKNNKVWPDMP
jgi:hypothetical protein